MIDPNTAVEAVIASVTVIGALYKGGKHLITRSKRKADKLRVEILREAKEEADKVKAEIEARIAKVEFELRTQKENVSKDLMHVKETYNSEIKILGQRIEDLRTDLNAQHANLIALLTKLVDSK